MPAVKSTAAVAEKWSRVTPMRQEDYKLGVQNPRTPWAQASKAAEDRYKTGVAEAATQGRYGKGVTAAGDQRWQSKALAKGPTRFAEGVALSAPDYQAGVAPYLDAIATELGLKLIAEGDHDHLQPAGWLPAPTEET